MKPDDAAILSKLVYGVPTTTEKMTREEFDRLANLIGNEAIHRWENGDLPNFHSSGAVNRVWDRIEAIQNAPFQPDWSLKPEDAIGFIGEWYYEAFTGKIGPGEFFICAPNNPTDAELVAMFDKLPIADKIRALDAVKE